MKIIKKTNWKETRQWYNFVKTNMTILKCSEHVSQCICVLKGLGKQYLDSVKVVGINKQLKWQQKFCLILFYLMCRDNENSIYDDL